MNLFELSAKLKLDSSEYEKGLSDAEGSANSFAAGGLSKLAEAARTGAKAVAAVGAAAAGAGTTVFKLAGKAAATGDKIDKMSQKLGISAQAYQEWDAIMRHSGTTIDSMQRGMVTLSKAAEDGSEDFEKLGLSQEKIASMNQEELFSATITGLQKMKSGTERTALAQKLLGGSAKELGALLNTSAAETEKMRQEVHDLGGVMSDDAVKSAAKYQDALQDMQTATSGFVRGAAEKALPSITNAFQTLTEFVTGPQGRALQKKLGEIISIIAEKAAVAIPRLISFVGDVSKSIKDNIALIGALVVAIKAIHSPVSAAVTAVGLLVGAFGLMKLTAQDVDVELENLSDSEKELVRNARNAATAFDESMEYYAKAVAGIDSEMENVQSAWDTLKGYVDENGKIAEGHEQEVSDLLTIINEALGTQYSINGDMIEQYSEMSDMVDDLIAKQWAQKLLDARSESYNLAQSELETAQKRLGIAKLERDAYLENYKQIKANRDALEKEIAKQKSYIEQLEHELRYTDSSTSAYEEKQKALEGAREEYGKLNFELEEVQTNLDEATYYLGMQQHAYSEASNEVDKLIGEIGRYDEAYSSFLEGRYEDTKDILESDIGYRWKHLSEGQKVSDAELEQMKRDYEVLYAAYEDYWDKLKKGQAGYNKEELQRMREQVLNLGGILSGYLIDAKEKGIEIGANIGAGVGLGIAEAKAEVVAKAKNLMSTVLSAMKNVAGIHSPSRKGRAIGENVGGSVGLGLEDSYNYVVSSAEDLMDGVLDNLSGSPDIGTTGGSGNNGFMGDVLGVLRDIRDNMGYDVVLDDGTLVGRIDKMLGQTAMRKARGNA